MDTHSSLVREGFLMARGVFSSDHIRDLLAAFSSAFASPDTSDPTLRADSGAVYGARNILRLVPQSARVWRQPTLLALLCETLGPRFGLVRGLFFDKPPGNSWALPWHKDLTIAVKNNRLPSTQFARPTRKAGVPHVEAPASVLESMLTLRIHLDEVTDENGPLKVVPGSHRSGKSMEFDTSDIVTLHALPGDVLLMRPLLAHCSNHSREDTARHRRILHLEFAGVPTLPDGYEWHDYLSS
jgi:hypothetical protein